MHNWDARDEVRAGKCTLDADWQSVQKTCEILKIDNLHRVNFQSSYWQRVFSPIVDGYASGRETPNPDILCNREIKFGDLFQWAMDVVKADALATGHYARIFNNQLRQSLDIGKDQTYFLSAVNASSWSRTIFPLGNVFKSQVKSELVKEANLHHLIGRKESMGICFVGKRDEFPLFIGQFIDDSVKSGPIVLLDSGQRLPESHKGLSFYTIGQSARIGGAGKRLYVAKKCPEENVLYVVDRQDHPVLYTPTIAVKNSHLVTKLHDYLHLRLYCSIRSNDKSGSRLLSVHKEGERIIINLEHPLYAPCSGQWAVFYAEDEHTKTRGKLCLGGAPISEM